jgi:Tol biopolymer transport system component
MNQKLFTVLEVVALGALVVFVMYVGGAFKGLGPSPTQLVVLVTVTPVQLTPTSALAAATPSPRPTSTRRPTATPTTAPIVPTLTKPAGLIAFESNRDGNSEIYVVDVESGLQLNITNNPAEDYVPVWSPDGERLAFFSTRTGWLEIYAMNPDGSEVTQLTHTFGSNTAYAHPFSWSPDGRQLVALRSNQWDLGRQPGPVTLDLIQADGSGITTLYESGEDYVWQPGWSPDGRFIAVMITGRSNTGLHVGNAGETPLNLSPLVSNVCYNYAWSPDGQIACYGGTGILVTNPDGSDRRWLGGLNGFFTSLAWSPDSNHLVFITENFSSPDVVSRRLYLTHVNDSRQQRELAGAPAPAQNSALSWSPDSQWIAYSSEVDGQTNIYIVNIYDDAQQRQLTTNARDNFSPQWQPQRP